MNTTYINQDDFDNNFWGKNYEIRLTSCGFSYTINAACLGDAIDELIDYLEVDSPGLLFSREDQAKVEADGFEGDYLNGGNHNRIISTMNYRIFEL